MEENLLRKTITGEPCDIERVTQGSERGCWKSALKERNSLATHSTREEIYTQKGETRNIYFLLVTCSDYSFGCVTSFDLPQK